MVHEKPQQGSSRQRSRALRTEEVLAAARELVVSEGVEAVTLHRVARALSYVPAALYRYFPSKEALLAALIGRALRDLGQALRDAVDLHDARTAPGRRTGAPAALARVLVCVRAFVAWGRAAPHEATLVSLALADPRVLVAQQQLAMGVLAEAAPGMQVVLEAVGRAVAEDALDDAPSVPVASMQLTAAVVGVWSVQKLTRLMPAAVDVEALVLLQARTVLRGLGARPATLAAAEARARVEHKGGL
jgi:AcrR family transcriptional regulator